MLFDFSAWENEFARVSFKMDINGRRRLWLKLAKLIGNGVPILQAFETIRARRVISSGKSHSQAVAISAWINGIKNGQRLSYMLNGWVSENERMLISAGEQSGTMEKALQSSARVMEAKKQINSAVFGGIAYPFILILLAFGVLILFGFKIVPAFLRLASPEKWTGHARAMIEVSLFAQQWLWLLALFVVVVIIAFFVSLPRWDGPLRIRLDRYAPYSIYRVMLGSTWLIGLSAMVEAGLRIEVALAQLSTTASPWLSARIEGCLRGTRSGLNVGEALARTGYGFPDVEIIDDLGVYSSLSGFDVALATLGKEWLEESVIQIQEKMRVVFGASMLLVGALVIFMVGGMMNMQLQLSHMLQSGMR
jgi:type II secretory pathway component PulF